MPARRLTPVSVAPAPTSLRRAGLDVVIMDRSRFPRDKACAGWITPPVLDDLQLDVDEYRRGRTFQPITGFRTGTIDGRPPSTVPYGRAVSYGIRRRQFDEYLLRRSGARLTLGAPVASIERQDGQWVLNGEVSAPMLKRSATSTSTERLAS